MQTLDVISVNIWQMVAALANLVLIFVMVKKFLYKPVKKMLDKRQSTIDGQYSAANQAREDAQADRLAYEEKLKNAKQEADAVIKSAVDTATEREKEIVADAKEKAEGIIRQAQTEAALEIRKAEQGIKKEIVDVSAALTEKLLEREISAEDHKNLIDSFIEGIGDKNDGN